MRIQTKIKKRYTFIVAGVLAMVTLVTAIGYAIYNYTNKTRAYLNGFDAGNIMSDFVMSNKSTMSEADINNFLHSKNPCNHAYDNTVKRYEGKGYQYTIRNDKVVCMADENFGGESAAHIIWQAAQDYSINPQVLIVLLQKEQGLVTDTYPTHQQYAKATGFACPDNGNGCDPINSGFKNQVRKAAKLFSDVLSGGWSNYPAYSTQFVQYSPNRACGGVNIYIQNRATSALYRYTPYVPNQAALNAGLGEGDGCSAYGNRNFYNYFTDWFGNTRSYEVKGEIKKRYDQLTGKAYIGLPVTDEVCPDKDTCWQTFQYGVIIWHNRTGAWETRGGVRERWAKLGYQGGEMGYPTGPEVWDGKGWYQNYQGGAIIGTVNTGYWESRGGVRERWAKLGYQGGEMGYPTGPEVWDGKGWYQNYQGGVITFSNNVANSL